MENKQWRQAFAEVHALESPHNPDHFRTVNLEDEYNGMLVQTDADMQYVDHWAPTYKRHSQYWNDRVDTDARRLNSELRESFAE